MSDFEFSDKSECFSDDDNIYEVDEYNYEYDYDYDDTQVDKTIPNTISNTTIIIDMDSDIDTNIDTNIDILESLKKQKVGKYNKNEKDTKNDKPNKTIKFIKQQKTYNAESTNIINISNKTNNETPIPKAISTTTKDKSKDKSSKPTAVDQDFEFNEENIHFFSKDLDAKKVLITKSPFSNDTAITCLLLKLKVFKEYHCNIDKCKVGTVWNGKPIQLLLHRKNNIHNDLTPNNLELICANCFMSLYGLDIFKKKEKTAILNCKLCGFPLVKFMNGRKKKGTCLSCEQIMKTISHETQESRYYNELQNIFSDSPTHTTNTSHNTHDISNTNYYKDVSRYKKLDATSIPKKDKSLVPIINLNMESLPDLSDIIFDNRE